MLVRRGGGQPEVRSCRHLSARRGTGFRPPRTARRIALGAGSTDLIDSSPGHSMVWSSTVSVRNWRALPSWSATKLSDQLWFAPADGVIGRRSRGSPRLRRTAR